MRISLDEAVELTRTGDVWVFRGRSVPDRAIQWDCRLIGRVLPRDH